MPVEIKELVIRAVIADNTEGKRVVENNKGSTAMVQECVSQVLKILKKQNQR